MQGSYDKHPNSYDLILIILINYDYLENEKASLFYEARLSVSWFKVVCQSDGIDKTKLKFIQKQWDYMSKWKRALKAALPINSTHNPEL